MFSSSKKYVPPQNMKQYENALKSHDIDTQQRSFCQVFARCVYYRSLGGRYFLGHLYSPVISSTRVAKRNRCVFQPPRRLPNISAYLVALSHFPLTFSLCSCPFTPPHSLPLHSSSHLPLPSLLFPSETFFFLFFLSHFIKFNDPSIRICN